MAGIKIVDLRCSYDFDLDPMTFIYELDPFVLKIYRIRKNELPMSRLSKVNRITDRHTDRQTRLKLYTTPLRGWSTSRP